MGTFSDEHERKNAKDSANTMRSEQDRRERESRNLRHLRDLVEEFLGEIISQGSPGLQHFSAGLSRRKSGWRLSLGMRSYTFLPKGVYADFLLTPDGQILPLSRREVSRGAGLLTTSETRYRVVTGEELHLPDKIQSDPDHDVELDRDGLRRALQVTYDVAISGQ